MLERAKEMVATALAPIAVTGPLTVSEDGWLEGRGVVRVPSPRHTRLTSRSPHGEPAPLGVCWHWTGGVCRPGYAGVLAKKIGTYDPKRDRAASWHVVISKQGWVYQSVPFELGSWHCAVGVVKDDAGWEHRVNRCLVGIELENAGRLKYLDRRWYCHPFWKRDRAGRYLEQDGQRVADPALEIDAARIRSVPGQGVFDVIPAAQVTAAACVLQAMATRYTLAPARCVFLHGDFDKGKEDAGPLWRNLLPEVFERAELDPAALVKAGAA